MALKDNYVLGDTSQYAVVVNVTEVPAGQPMKINPDGRLGTYLTASNMENETEFQYADIAETPNIIKIGTSSFSIWTSTPTVKSILGDLE